MNGQVLRLGLGLAALSSLCAVRTAVAMLRSVLGMQAISLETTMAITMWWQWPGQGQWPEHPRGGSGGDPKGKMPWVLAFRVVLVARVVVVMEFTSPLRR